MKTLQLLCLAVTGVCAAYPSTYPFENESYVPPAMLASEPSETYDDTDTGGYIYTYAHTKTLTEDDLPYAPIGAGMGKFMLVVAYGAPPELPASSWNCTAKELLPLSDADFTGVINSQTVCAVGSCCEEFFGLPRFSENQMEWHSMVADRATGALCEDIQTEVYCTFVLAASTVNCVEYFPGVTERPVVVVCADNYALYYFTCPIYLQQYNAIWVMEPPLYVDQLTQELFILSEAFALGMDRICHPYSYYHPESLSPSSTTSSTTSSSASSGSESTSTESSGAKILTLFSLLVFSV